MDCGKTTCSRWIICARESVSAAMAQQDPLVAYKRESFDVFEAMMTRFQEDTVRYLFLMQIVGPDGQPVTEVPLPRPRTIEGQKLTLNGSQCAG